MNITGLIVEYNPFHNGHIYHLQKSLEKTNADASIAVMSGNFIQRGEPALFDKFSRAKAAVESGVDLVVELPSIYASQSAELFAKGSVALLNSLGCVNSICFGSEEGNINALYLIASILCLEPQEFKEKLSSYLSEGMLFPTARNKALFDYINSPDFSFGDNFNNIDLSEERLNEILSSSNNILGIEYIKQLISLKSEIKPFTIGRIHSEYNSEEISGNINSATAVRKKLHEIISSKENNSSDIDELIKSIQTSTDITNSIPESTLNMITSNIEKGFLPIYPEYFFETLISTIIRDKKNLESYFDISEGIENKIFKAALVAKDYEDLLNLIKSKRYTMTRIKRCLNNILLGVTKEDMEFAKKIDTIPYVRILTFNSKGREVIREIKKSSEIKIINKFSEVEHFMDDKNFKFLIENDIKCTDIYNTIYYKKNRPLLKGSMDYFIKPIYVR
ncbi:nucleotidyltransferase [Peptacetobacter hiranonis]|uniref:nucleotidyltransferase n=1 Tax=Peptacetobacter hiranonis TaxID=89152 RepID=UPI002E75A953|nr:nucleotidyltransferase [Peptacetobacter hiranonis]MEE0248628.1 nucleotidyltransferase [Peptacetobacter hiranonis]